MAEVPSAASLSEGGALIPPADSLALLSKPTLDLTFDDMKRIAEDLRAKRIKFLEGKADKPPRSPAVQLSDEDKEARGAYVKGLLGNLKIS